MKATSLQTLSPAALADKHWVLLAADLFKARLTFLVLVTTLVGFYLGYRGPVDAILMLHTLLGTALLASGAAALNQLFERNLDARMRRTKDRPLPSGRLQPATVAWLGIGTSVAGALWLLLLVNPLTALLGVVSSVIYLFAYTPLKQVTWVNTLVGAIPGGLPPLMGWTAARGEISWEGVSLFAILAFWQIPHFMAIAWIYREEYGRAGFQMLPVVDPAGRRTARQAVVHTVGLLIVSVAPFAFGLTGYVYLAGALALGLAFGAAAVQFARGRELPQARRLFYASILYLPLLMALGVLDKVKTAG